MKTDLRIIKTKKNIYESLLKLLETKTFEKIKVSEICTTAMINRSTFYAHFDDKYTLLDSLINDLRTSLKEELNQNKITASSKEYYMELIRILLNHLEEKKDIYIPIMQNNRHSVAMDMAYETLKEKIAEQIKKGEGTKKNSIPSAFVSDFYLGALFNVGVEWIQSHCALPKEEILSYLNTLIPDKLA